MGACGSVPHHPSDDSSGPQTSAAGSDKKGRKSRHSHKNKHSTRVFEEHHYVPFHEPEQLRRNQSQQFNIIFLVQFSQFIVHLHGEEADSDLPIFCNITWDYEQFQTSIINSTPRMDGRWEDHVFKYACDRDRLQTALAVLQVYEHTSHSATSKKAASSVSVTSVKKTARHSNTVASNAIHANYRLIGDMQLNLKDIVNGPWRVNHCIKNAEGVETGRLKFRCRVQPLQKWTLQIDNVHAYINKQQANHIVSVATALETVHSTRATYQVIGDEDEENESLAEGRVLARLDLLEYDEHASASSIAGLLAEHLAKTGEPPLNEQTLMLDCSAVCALEDQLTLVQFLETVLVWQIALPVAAREQAIIMHDRRRTSHGQSSLQDSVNHALSLSAPADADQGDPIASLQQRRRASLGAPGAASGGSVRSVQQMRKQKKARLSHRSLRRAPTISDESETDMHANAAINMERIYAASQVQAAVNGTEHDVDDLFIVRRAPVEVAVSNFGIEIGTITMDISFHEMNFHQQYNGCISEEGYFEDIGKVERFSRRPSLTNDRSPHRPTSSPLKSGHSSKRTMKTPTAQWAGKGTDRAQSLWTPRGRHRSSSGFKQAIANALLPAPLVRLHALTKEIRTAFNSKSSSKRHQEALQKQIKEANAILARSDHDTIVSFFPDVSSGTVHLNRLADAARVLVTLFILVNTMIDVMYDAKQRRKLMKTALRLIQRSEPYQAIEIAFSNLHDVASRKLPNGGDALCHVARLDDLRSDVSFCVERYTEWRACMVRAGTLACPYVGKPDSLEFPRACAIIGALIYRMPTMRNVVLDRLRDHAKEVTALRKAAAESGNSPREVVQHRARTSSATASELGSSKPNPPTNGSHVQSSDSSNEKRRDSATPPPSPFFSPHHTFRSSRENHSLRMLTPEQVLEVMCILAEEDLNLRTGSSGSRRPSATVDEGNGSEAQTPSAAKEGGDTFHTPLCSVTAHFVAVMRDEERLVLHSDPCYFWDRHEAVVISVLTQQKVDAIDAKLVKLASGAVRAGTCHNASRRTMPSSASHVLSATTASSRKGWLEVLCVDEMAFAYVVKHWLCEVVHGMVAYHKDSISGLSDTVVVADSPSMKKDRGRIHRFLSKSHILPWDSVPGYQAFVDQLLWRLDGAPPGHHCVEFIDTVKYACSNHQLLAPVVRTLLRRTSIYDTANVAACLGVIDDFFASYSHGWTTVTAFGHHTLEWLNAKMLPLSFDYSFFFKALDVLLSSDNGQLLWKTLGLLFRHWKLFTELQANRLRERIIKRHFFSLMTHWSPQGREFFVALMLFRVSKPRDFEESRAYGLKVLSANSSGQHLGRVSHRRHHSGSSSISVLSSTSSSLTNSPKGYNNGDHFESGPAAASAATSSGSGLISQKAQSHARVKKPWINHAVSTPERPAPKRTNSGKELWNIARIRLSGVTKWLVRDPEAVAASARPLPLSPVTSATSSNSSSATSLKSATSSKEVSPTHMKSGSLEDSLDNLAGMQLVEETGDDSPKSSPERSGIMSPGVASADAQSSKNSSKTATALAVKTKRPSFSDLAIDLMSSQALSPPREDAFRRMVEKSLALAVSLELYDVAHVFLNSVARSQTHKNVSSATGENVPAQENSKVGSDAKAGGPFVVFRGAAFVKWFLDHPHIFLPNDVGDMSLSPRLELSRDDDVTEDVIEERREQAHTLAEKLLHAGFFFPVETPAPQSSPRVRQRPSLAYRSIKEEVFRPERIYFSPELRKWEGWCYSYKVDSKLKNLGGLSDPARLLCCAALREFRRLTVSRTELDLEVKRIESTQQPLRQTRDKKVRLVEQVNSDISLLEGQLARSLRVLQDLRMGDLVLQASPELGAQHGASGSANASSGANTDDNSEVSPEEGTLQEAFPAYSKEVLESRLAAVDRVILYNALRPSDTTRWDSYLLHALVQWNETEDLVYEYMADPNAELPEPTWDIEVHDEVTGAATEKLSV